MQDSPQKFIKDVMDTDDQFIQGLDADTVLSIGLLPNPFGILDPPVNVMLYRMKHRMHEIFTETKKIVDNPPKCIEDEDIYITKNYVVESEIPFVMDAINSTVMKDHVTVPDGVEELRQQLLYIPCCHESEY